jgi:hypothetical protein
MVWQSLYLMVLMRGRRFRQAKTKAQMPVRFLDRVLVKIKVQVKPRLLVKSRLVTKERVRL